MLLVDFNMTPEEKNLQFFADSFNLEHLIMKPACFKGSPSCTDLIGKPSSKKHVYYKLEYQIFTN